MKKAQTKYPLEFQTAADLARPKTAAIYVRVSTDKQEVQNQFLQLRAYTKRSHYKIFKEYVDIISGKEDSRPSWDSLFLDAHKKLFDIILFWDLSRFSRSGTLFTLQKLQELDNLGIGYISYQEPYLNTTGMFKDVVISILATFAKIERIQISERTKAGLERARKNGVHLGRGVIPPETIEEISSMLRDGASITKIHDRVKYRLHSGELRHPSIGKISAIKQCLSKKEGAFSG
jgi:DNA invertase Pin-like site-specific DNA recombinase